MELGVIVGLVVDPKLKAAQRARLFRQLYGWKDKSQFGKYEYEREGLLTDIPHVKLMRGVFIVRKQDKKKVTDFLKDKADVLTRQVVLTASDRKKLFRDK